MAAVSCGTSHASAVSTPLRWIFKKYAIQLVTHVEPHASAVSLLKRAENSATKAIINQSINQSIITNTIIFAPLSPLATTEDKNDDFRPNVLTGMDDNYHKSQ